MSGTRGPHDTLGPYARLYDLCEARGWSIALAGGPNADPALTGDLVIEIRASTGAVRRAFKVPRGRTIDEAATALLHELYAEATPEGGGTAP